MRRRWSRNAKTLAGGLAALAAFAAVMGTLRLKRFVDEDPRLCATCHRASPEFALWMGGTHHTVACQRCHHATTEQGLAMLRSFVAGERPTGKHADVEVGACASCHFSHDPRWPQVGGSRGHKLHYEEKGIACVRCHAASMHGFEPIASRCQECHPGHAVNDPKMASLHCFACHDFLADGPGLRPTRRDCLRCHTAQGIRAPMSDSPVKMECASCHRPHRPRGRTLAACAECHTPEAMAQGGLHGIAAHRTCLDCHRPHVWIADASGCTRCHAGARRHAAGKPCLDCHSFRGAPLPARAAVR
ncbi:hypothetical protein [Anaeromyxobacter oryzisoli]|uniref:hypothetical protein n=1 Tax=Anaeromyxobacter oryzisoli TaxID=2925408 RepID=UPI001F581791|nr:hypothetical protein [Anaeromyxobacter sp. SG63]